MRAEVYLNEKLVGNHSGIIDNLRNFKGDPNQIASSLMPVRPVLKQHALSYASGERAVFDLYLLNDTDAMPKGRLRLEMIDPAKKKSVLRCWEIPGGIVDQFSYLIAKDVTSPPLQGDGVYQFALHCDGLPEATCLREIWVVETNPSTRRKLRVGLSGVVPSLMTQLAALTGIEVAPFETGQQYDVLVASGVVAESKLNHAIGEETGQEALQAGGAHSDSTVRGRLSADLLDAVRNGTPLLAAVPDDYLADGVAEQLASLNAFEYHGQVGDLRAPWMGNWMFVREHETFSGLPVNTALGIHYQAPGKQANGLLIERADGAPDPDVFLGYSRDHDRKIGAASFVCHVGDTRVLVHRSPEFSAPLQARWLMNALRFLAQKQS